MRRRVGACQVALASCQDDYKNFIRPHNALANLALTEYADSASAPQRAECCATSGTRCSTEPHGSNVTGISPSVDEPRGSGAPEKAVPLHNKAVLIVGAFTQYLRQEVSCSLSKPRSPVIQTPQIDTILESPFTSKSQKS